MSRSGAKATGSETPLAPTERGRRITWHWSADVECVIGIDKQMGPKVPRLRSLPEEHAYSH